MGWQDDPIVSSVGAQPAWASDPIVSAAPEPEPETAPSATGMERVGAAAAGVNRGVASLAGLPMDTIQNIIDLGKALSGVVYHETTGKDIPEALQIQGRENVIGSGENIARGLDKLTTSLGAGPVTQAPRPDDPASRYLYAAGQGASAGLIGPAGGARVLPAIVSGVTGAQAAQVAAESGASPLVQTGAALAGSVLPGGVRATIGATGKGIVRGGEAGRQRVAENIRAFERSGDTPSMGQATQNRRVQAAESLLSKTPGGAGVMEKRAEAKAANIGAGIERSAASLAPKSSGEQAGRAIQTGVSGTGGFLEKFNAKSEQLYNEIDRFVPAATPVSVANTQQSLAKLTRITPGAAATSKRLINPKIAQLTEDVKADAATGTMPYEALKDIRTRIGAEISGGALKSDVPTAELKQVYSALSRDLETAARSAGPQATQAYTRANNYYRAGSRRMEVLESVINRNGGPEAIFKSATSGTKEGATTLRTVMQSIPKDQQKIVTATVLRRLGRATAGKQDDLGETFSTETFLTNWNSMAPEAKAVLFNRYGPTFRGDMDNVAKVAANLRQGSKVFVNPSGTGQAVAQATTAATFIMSLLTGNLPTAAGIAAGVGGANLSARLLTNPTAVRWLATKTRAPVSALPALIAQLGRSDDPDLNELGQVLEQAEDQP